MFIKLLISILKVMGGTAQIFLYFIALSLYLFTALAVWIVSFHPKSKLEDSFEPSRAAFPLIKK